MSRHELPSSIECVMAPILRRLSESASSVFDGTPVVFAYLYGSHARGEAGPRSDIDIAAYFSPHDESSFDCSLRLAGELEDSSGCRPISALLILNEAPIAIAGRAIQDGQLIYSRDDSARVRHFSLTQRQFHDFRIREERSARERLARMAGGS